MWFNWIRHQKPYYILHTLYINLWLINYKDYTQRTGTAWLSSVRVVRRLVKSILRTQPLIYALIHICELSYIQHLKMFETEMKLSIHGPYDAGNTCNTMIFTIRCNSANSS